MEKDFESIRSKVQKLQALAERGEKGEALNAKRLLDQLLAKYGVSLEEIVEAQEEKQQVSEELKVLRDIYALLEKTQGQPSAEEDGEQ